MNRRGFVAALAGYAVYREFVRHGEMVYLWKTLTISDYAWVSLKNCHLRWHPMADRSGPMLVVDREDGYEVHNCTFWCV